MARYRTLNLFELPELVFFFVAMFPFAFSLLGLWVGIKLFHKRPFKSIINPGKQIRWRQFFLSGLLWLVLSAVTDGVMALLQPGNISWTFDVRRFAPFLFLTLILIPIQAGTEELIFRGYLTQAVGLLSRGAWLAILVPSILFGIVHGLNPEVGSFGFGVMMIYYIGMGLLLGWVTLRSAGLELAAGIHIANNLYASLVVTFPESAIQSPALFTVREFNPNIGVLIFLIMTAVYLLFTFRIKSSPFRYDLVRVDRD
jgi:uncharacterized protein